MNFVGIAGVWSSDHDGDVGPPLLDRGLEPSVRCVDVANAADDEAHVDLILEEEKCLFSAFRFESPVVPPRDGSGGKAPNPVRSNDQDYAFHQATPYQHTPTTAYTLGTLTRIAGFSDSLCWGHIFSHLDETLDQGACGLINLSVPPPGRSHSRTMVNRDPEGDLSSTVISPLDSQSGVRFDLGGLPRREGNMINEQFIEACAQALHREHGHRASEIIAAQVTTLQMYNPTAAGNWRKIAEHLPHDT